MVRRDTLPHHVRQVMRFSEIPELDPVQHQPMLKD
jgi:hypothetical protein